MAKKQARPLRVRSAFAVGNRVYRRGGMVRSDDPVVKGREHLFVDVLDELGIEQATKNPGQKRAAKKPDPLDMSNTKAELLAAAEGLDVDESNTKAEILEALEA